MANVTHQLGSNKTTSNHETDADMFVSVCLAVFNGEKWLPQQLESIASQSRPPDQLVVSDDASTDRSREIVRQFADQAPFEVVIIENSRRLGYSKNFERSMRRCSGDIVLMCDQDDVWLWNKIETIVHGMRSGDYLLVLHDAWFVDSRLDITPPSMFERFQQAGYGLDWIVKGCCTAVRRELLELAIPIPDGFPHDTWLHRLSQLTEGRRLIIEVPLIFYRIHDGNTSSSLYLNDLESSFLAPIGRIRQRLVSVGYQSIRSLASLEEELAATNRLLDVASDQAIFGAAQVEQLHQELESLMVRINFRHKSRFFRIIRGTIDRLKAIANTSHR